jgi:Fe2+ or Zn2+ uptake regulation protein
LTILSIRDIIENDFQYRLSSGKDGWILDKNQSWYEKLVESGYRLTESRRTVVDVVAGSQRALSPLEVFDQGRRTHSGLGLVTVYRTLEKLEELGLIQRVHQPQGCQAFIAAFQGHQHLLLCSACGQVQFFDGDNLDGLIQKIHRQTGYQVQDHWLQLFGLCGQCQKQAQTKDS